MSIVILVLLILGSVVMAIDDIEGKTLQFWGSLILVAVFALTLFWKVWKYPQQGTGAPAATTLQQDATVCKHAGAGWLAPRWANSADMGHYDKIVDYRCGNCKAVLSPEEAAPLLPADTK